jgi:hypothetical protein
MLLKISLGKNLDRAFLLDDHMTIMFITGEKHVMLIDQTRLREVQHLPLPPCVFFLFVPYTTIVVIFWASPAPITLLTN